MRFFPALIITFSLPLTGLANTHFLKKGQIYLGRELRFSPAQEKKTSLCGIEILDVKKTDGHHCYQITYDYKSQKSLEAPRETLKVDSRYTNNFQANFPQVKSCAKNLDGSTYGDEIYGQDTTEIYNRTFVGFHRKKVQTKKWWKPFQEVDYHSFLFVSPITKLASKASVNVVRGSKELLIECRGLTLKKVK